MKQSMKKGSFVPKNVPGVGWVMEGVCYGGVEWVMEGWGGSYTEQLGYGGQPSLSAQSTTLIITWNYWGSQIQL